MLVKADMSEIVKDLTGSFEKNQLINIYTAESDCVCNVSGYVKSSNYYSQLDFQVNGTSVLLVKETATYTTKEYNENITLNAGDELKTNVSSGYSSYTTIDASIKAIASFKKSEKIISGYPIEIKNLGSRIEIIIYGMKDGTYIGGRIAGDTTSATTGSITLGNAVGYLEVDYNGTTVKIPYYGD